MRSFGAVTLSLTSLLLSVACATQSRDPDVASLEPGPEREPAVAAAKLSDDEMAKKFADWAAVRTPSKDATEPIGRYAGGCIQGAQPLSLQTPGLVVMRPSRRAYYGHPSLLQYITSLSEKTSAAGFNPLLIGDLSRPRGGPVPKGHDSHQTGLDVDIFFDQAWSGMTDEEKEAYYTPSFVEDRRVLKASWTKEQTKLIELAASAPSVERVLVAPAIKKMLCETQPTAPWLYKLRGWWGHEDHMHVRLGCPAGSAACVSQTPRLDPTNNGCGADLGWWFSKEAETRWKAIQAYWEVADSKDFPRLPVRCESVRIAD